MNIGSIALDIETNVEKINSTVKAKALPVSGRRDTHSSLAMFVSPDGKNIDTAVLTSQVINAIKQDMSRAFDWAQDWGRVIVAVHPNKPNSVSIQPINNKTRSFVKVETTKLFNPEYFIDTGNNGKYQIIINSQPVTLEGFIVQFVHLLDEVIWQEMLASFGNINAENYAQAIENVIHGGIKIKTLSTKKILEEKVFQKSKFKIREYGSNKIKSINKIMGGTIKLPDIYSEKINLQLDDTSVKTTHKKVDRNLGGNLSVLMSITLSKPLHIGHFFHLSLAELISRPLAKSDVILISNDTGPRVAKTVLRLSELTGYSINKVAELLRAGAISHELISNAYRTRKKMSDISKLSLALKEIDGGGGVLKLPEENTLTTLHQAGFSNIKIKRESKLQKNSMINLSDLTPEWTNTGFSTYRTDHGISVIEKNGKLTSTAKFTNVAARLCNHRDGVIILDGIFDSYHTHDLLESTGFTSLHIKGVGISINGAMVSGTEFKVPLIKNLIDKYGNELSEILTYFNLTVPMVSDYEPNGRYVYVNFDFADTESLKISIEDSRRKLTEFKARIKRAICKLQDSNGGTTVLMSKHHNELIYGWVNIEDDKNHDKYLSKIKKFKVINEDVSFERIVNKYSNIWKGDARLELLSLLNYHAPQNITELTRLINDRQLTVNPISEVNANDAVKSRFLNIAKSQGYKGELAVNKALDYQRKDLYLSKRDNFYYKNVNNMLDVVESAKNISKRDARKIETKLKNYTDFIGIDLDK